jgi:hypothetical protein
MGTAGPFPGNKARPGRDTDHSPPSSAEVVNEYELYLLSPQAPPWRVEGLFYFTFLWYCAILQNSTQSGTAFVTAQPQNFASSPHLKSFIKQNIIIYIKLVGMSMIFYCTKLHFVKYRGSRLVYINKNSTASHDVFFGFHRDGLIK